MKWVEIPEREFYDENTTEFITVPGCKFKIEHSLVSLAKWEMKWKVPFLHSKLNREQLLSYIECMTITQNVDPGIYRMIPKSILNDIEEYINESQTATTIHNNQPNRPPKREIITAELIYFWMFSYGIPIDCEKWHLSRLLTLIEVFSIKNDTKGKKMSKGEIMRQNSKINAARRAKYHSKG